MPVFSTEILESIGAQYDPEHFSPTDFHSIALASPAFLYGVRRARFRRVCINDALPLYDFRRRLDEFAAILPTISLFVHEIDLDVYPDFAAERSLTDIAKHLVQASNIRHLSLRGPFTVMGNMRFPPGLVSLVTVSSLTLVYLSSLANVPLAALAGLHLTELVVVEDCSFGDSDKCVSFDFEANRRLGVRIRSAMPALTSFLPTHAVDVPEIQMYALALH